MARPSVALDCGIAVSFLLRAKNDGRIQALKPEIEALRTQARFFGSGRLEEKVLGIAEE
jgi:predicted nucleic acid-binding protein